MHPGRRIALARSVPAAVMTLGAAITVVASFSPWLRSGSIARSSYDLLGLFHLLRISRHRTLRILVRLWPVVPLLATGAVVAAWWGRRRVAALLGLLGGLYATGVGAAVARAARQRFRITVTAAPAWTAVGGVILILGSLALLAVRVPSATSPSDEGVGPTNGEPNGHTG